MHSGGGAVEASFFHDRQKTLNLVKFHDTPCCQSDIGTDEPEWQSGIYNKQLLLSLCIEFQVAYYHQYSIATVLGFLSRFFLPLFPFVY